MMGFVDHQYGRQFLLAARNHVTGQLQQEFTLVLARGRQSQIAGNVLQKLQRRQPSVEYVRILDVVALLQRLQQTAEQKGLARSAFAGQDDESLMPPDAIVKRGQSFVVPPGRKQERRIRSNLERIALQAVKGFVHGQYSR